MFETIHTFVLAIHITIGSIALIIFWLPIIEKKGSPFHRRAGNWFVWGMTAVALSGILMSSLVFIDPLAVRDPERLLSLTEANRIAEIGRSSSAFLFMLSFLVLCATRQSVLALEAKADRTLMKAPSHLICIVLLLLSAIYVGMLGLQRTSPLYEIFAALSIFSSISMLRYIYKKDLKKSEWIIEHLTNIMASGIAAYTAFFVFGGQSFLNNLVPGDYQILFWIMPGVIGATISRTFAVKYRKQYRVA